jgi:hypothetical protein
MSVQRVSKNPKRTSIVLAEYETAKDVLHAAEVVRDAGYRDWDVHTPFPVHGMDRAMGLGDSRLGWTVLIFALTGLTGAFVMMYWMGSIDYPFVVGGKPPNALPPMAPILFELTILASAFGTVLGMLHLNRLPRHHHAVFQSERFKAASDDRFFISIEARDPKFDAARACALLAGLRATDVELLEEVSP